MMEKEQNHKAICTSHSSRLEGGALIDGFISLGIIQSVHSNVLKNIVKITTASIKWLQCGSE